MIYLSVLNHYRDWEKERAITGGHQGDDDNGAFVVPSPEDGGALRVVASRGYGWEHVSVSRADRIPTWTEMEKIASMFFAPHETAMQLHVPAPEHINCHPHCLHWWRPVSAEAGTIPKPPRWMVGPEPAATR